MKQETCEERVEERLEWRMDDLRQLWAAYMQTDCTSCEGTGINPIPDELGEYELDDCPLCEGTGTMPEYIPDMGDMYEYGLGFFYVPHGTQHNDQGYFQYQLSWGGPSDEFRFFVDLDYHLYDVEYWFMDWFDGAMRHPIGEDLELIEEIFDNFFVESGAAKYQVEQTRD